MAKKRASKKISRDRKAPSPSVKRERSAKRPEPRATPKKAVRKTVKKVAKKAAKKSRPRSSPTPVALPNEPFHGLDARLRQGGVPVRDRKRAKLYYERRVSITAPNRLGNDETTKTLQHHRGYYFQKHVKTKQRGKDGKPKERLAWFTPDGKREVKAKVALKYNQENARPTPGSKKWKQNDIFRLHRGYYFKGPDGRWRTPDGKRLAKPDIAKKHNVKHNARLLREDAYYSLLSRGIPVRKREFLRATKKADRSRTSIRDAVLQSGIIRKGVERANRYSRKERAKEQKRIQKELRKARGPGGLGGFGEGEGGGGPDHPADEERAQLSGASTGSRGEEDSFFEYDPDTAFNDWYLDYEDMDGGDTP